MCNPIFLTFIFDVTDLLFDLLPIELTHSWVRVGVIPNFKTHLSQFTDLTPTHVMLFVFKPFKLTNEKGGAKTHFFEQWSYECSLTGGGIIKS